LYWEQTYISVDTDFQDGGERTGSLSYWSAEIDSNIEVDAKIYGLVVT